MTMTDSKRGPTLDDAERAGMRDFHASYEKHYDEMNADLMKVVMKLPSLAKLVENLDAKQLAEQQKKGREQMKRAILDEAWEPLLADGAQQGAVYAGMGIPFHEWFDLITAFQRTLIPKLIGELRADPARLASALVAMNIYVDTVMSNMAEAYLKTKEQIISVQRSSIEELSTPVLLIGPRLLLVPLVGLLDTDRARKLTESLLHAVRAHRAKAVVIDITGVPAVDSKVANHIFQTVAAARLMGARSVVTGLTAEVAQALVTLGVDVERLHTAGDLREGLEEARHMLRRRGLDADALHNDDDEDGED
jgi:rsbT co-antagonist protein RsbR